MTHFRTALYRIFYSSRLRAHTLLFASREVTGFDVDVRVSGCLACTGVQARKPEEEGNCITQTAFEWKDSSNRILDGKRVYTYSP